MSTTAIQGTTNQDHDQALERSSRRKRWIGRAVSALPVLGMGTSVVMKLSHAPDFLAMWTNHLGFPESTLTPIGLLEALCVLLYAIPRTSLLGAVLLTGYLGGAIASHVRLGEPFTMPLLFGVLAWVGLYLRDERVRAAIAGIVRAPGSPA